MAFLVFVQNGEPARAAEESEVTPQIVGGNPVPNGRYPFVAALLDTRNGRTAPKQQFFCGGTLIDRNSVLTAAHCVYRKVPRRYLRVTVGRTVLNSSQGHVRRATAVYVHPGYRSSSFRYDVAVIKLKSPVRNARPIKLATARQNFLEKPGRKVTVPGWGNTTAQPVNGTKNRLRLPNRLRKTTVPVVSDRYTRSVYGRSFVPALMVAAEKAGRDTCQGDSGGPMFGRASGAYRQIGIVSWGAGCAAKGYPGVYTEVNAYPIKRFITNAARR